MSDLRPSRLIRNLAAAVGAAVVLTITSACGGSTGDSNAADDADSTKPLIYGAFATPLEEPWDGAIHAALMEAKDEGAIRYKYVDNLDTADKMERGLRDIADNEKPDAIIGDAFAAEEAVRKVAAEYPDIPFAFGSGEKPIAPNMSVFDNWLQDPAYLAGMLAGASPRRTRSGSSRPCRFPR